MALDFGISAVTFGVLDNLARSGKRATKQAVGEVADTAGKKVDNIVDDVAGSARKGNKEIDIRGGYGSQGQEVPYLSDFFEGADDGIIRGFDEPTFYSVKN